MHTSRSEQEEVPIEAEVPGMTLTDLIDCTQRSAADGVGLPCRGGDPELWFAESPQDVEFAKALCSVCPLQSTCLAGALQRSEPWGVWGGELFVAGATVARKRPRGRPRKVQQAAQSVTTARASKQTTAA